MSRCAITDLSWTKVSHIFNLLLLRRKGVLFYVASYLQSKIVFYVTKIIRIYAKPVFYLQNARFRSNCFLATYQNRGEKQSAKMTHIFQRVHIKFSATTERYMAR